MEENIHKSFQSPRLNPSVPLCFFSSGNLRDPINSPLLVGGVAGISRPFRAELMGIGSLSHKHGEERGPNLR